MPLSSLTVEVEIFFTICFWCFSCQFVVKDSGDYTVQMMDPDVLVNWDSVEQVVSTDITKFCDKFVFCLKDR